MKHIFKTSLFLLLGAFALFYACKKEELDTTALTDFPPGILSISPADKNVIGSGENFDVVVHFVSGSVSTLASSTVKLTNASGAEIKSLTETLSGTADSIVMPGSSFNAASLPLGDYTLSISVTDVKGKSQNRSIGFKIGVKPKIGIIGTATPTGWGSDTDMPEVSPGVYELVITLTDGVVKFRADDSWTANWGANSFPTGVGTHDGPDIPVPAGIWKVRFEFPSGAYSFTPGVSYASNASNLYLLGSFNNFQGDEYKFSLVANNTWALKEALLKPGQLFKFAEDPFFMGKNWGDNPPADGKADEFGENITFAAPEGEAYYKVTFNDKTRNYTFEFVRYPSIGIIGDATPGGWNTDTDMTNAGNGDFKIKITLTNGKVKFRANDSWDTNWGGNGFPSGTAVPGGPDIPVTAGTYNVTFNPGALTYNFELEPGFQDVGVIGDATPGGWNTDTDMKGNGDGTFTLLIGLKDGKVKFRANNTWDVNWGGTGFPTGTATQNGPDIAVTKGLYLVTFNSITGDYDFKASSVGLVGDATPGGWNTDTDMTPDDTDPNIQKLNITLLLGKVKFRLNDGWDVNWGGSGFPAGTGIQGGPDISVPAGTYNVTFDVLTGAYNFN